MIDGVQEFSDCCASKGSTYVGFDFPHDNGGEIHCEGGGKRATTSTSPVVDKCCGRDCWSRFPYPERVLRASCAHSLIFPYFLLCASPLPVFCMLFCLIDGSAPVECTSLTPSAAGGQPLPLRWACPPAALDGSERGTMLPRGDAST